MRPRLLALVAVLVIAAGAAVALLDGGGGSSGSPGDVAAAVGEQLRYVDRGSSLVVAVDLRYREENWEHVRALASRALRQYRALVSVEERLRVPPNLSGALNQLASFAGLSFDTDVRPLLDGYLVVGVTVPPRQPLPPDIERLRRRLGTRRPLAQADLNRVLMALERHEAASEPRVVAAYRTHAKGLRRVLEKAQEGDPLESLEGRDGVWLLDPNTALVGDATLVFSSGDEEQSPEEQSPGKASPALARALDRADAGRGFPERRLAAAQRSADAADPLVLATGDLTVGRLLVEEPGFRRALRQVRYLRAVRGLAGAVAIDRDGLQGVARVETDPAQLRGADLPVGRAGRLELPARDDAVVGASRDQSATTAFAARLARTLFADSHFVRAVEQTERRLGIRFEEEFLRQFSCPSVSVFEPRSQRFAARSCVRDPERMRALLPRLAPHLPKILTGLQTLENEGLVTLLLVAPDAPLTPSTLGALASIAIRPLAGPDRGRASERLYELSGLRDPRSRLAPAGPDRVVFGMIGDDFIVASDRQTARAATRIETRSGRRPAASAIRVPAALLLAGSPDDVATKVAARLIKDLAISVTADRSGLTARAELGFSR